MSLPAAHKHLVQTSYFQTLLFSLWFLFELNLVVFCIGLVVLYILFIVWDFLTKSCFENRFLFIMDVAGFLLSILFAAFILYNSNVFALINSGSPNSNESFKIISSNNYQFVWGAVALAYLIIPILAICVNEYDLLFKLKRSTKNSTKLFNRKAWSRDGLT